MAIVKNLATVKTTADITSSATSIPVNRVNVFGDAPFYVTIMPASGDEPANLTNSEIALVTGISGSNLTVTRGQRSTTAKSFNSGAIVTMGIYAEDAVLLGDEGSTTNTTVHEKKLVDKDGNTIIPIMGYMGKVYDATISSTSVGIDTYTFTPDMPIENNRVYAVKFPTPIVSQDAVVLAPDADQKNTIILGDGVVSGSILIPPVAATDSPNYELLNTDMINNTEPLLLMFNGVQWVCLNQKKKVDTADLEDDSVTSNKIDWATLYKAANPLSALLPVNANTETDVQSFTLPAGKWRVFWAVRGYGGYHQADMTFAGLKANGVKVQSIGANDATVGDTLRPYISCSYELNITTTSTVSTYIQMVMQGNVSAETTYLFALRVG